MSPASISTEVDNTDNKQNKPPSLDLKGLQKTQDEEVTKENGAITKTTIIIPPDGGWGWAVMVGVNYLTKSWHLVSLYYCLLVCQLLL